MKNVCPFQRTATMLMLKQRKTEQNKNPPLEWSGQPAILSAPLFEFKMFPIFSPRIQNKLFMLKENLPRSTCAVMFLWSPVTSGEFTRDMTSLSLYHLICKLRTMALTMLDYFADSGEVTWGWGHRVEAECEPVLCSRTKPPFSAFTLQGGHRVWQKGAGDGRRGMASVLWRHTDRESHVLPCWMPGKHNAPA